MNILIVKLSAVGDVIHTLPSLAALRRHYPAAHITWVVEEQAADLIAGHPYLDEVLVSRRKSWARDLGSGEFRRPFREIGLFWKQLRRRRYDLVIDFHGLWKSSVIVFFSRGKRKMGYDSMQELSGLFVKEKIYEDLNKHAVDRYLDFPRYLGAPVGEAEFILPQTAETGKKAKGLLDEYALEEKKFIAVNPVAYWKTKLWDNHKFAKLADLIFRVAAEKHIPLQSEIITGGYSADGSEIQKYDTGRPAILLGVPVRYTHAHIGVIDGHDFDEAVDLVAAILPRLDAATVEEIARF